MTSNYPNDRVLVCGGTKFNKKHVLYRVLDVIDPKHIISGAADGADTLAEQYAIYHRIPRSIYPAQWNTYGKAAGPIRNKQMLDDGKPTMVVGFGGDKGTKDMLKRSKKAGLPVMRYIDVKGYDV